MSAAAHASAKSDFGQEPVAGMDRVDAGLARNADDVVDVEVRLDRGLSPIR
jgi:hypothetical protein